MLPEKYYFTRELLWRRSQSRGPVLKQVPDTVTVANAHSVDGRLGVSPLLELVKFRERN